MESLNAFLSMGGYGGYVWSSYALTVVVLAGVLWASVRAARLREAELEQLQSMRPNRRRRRVAPDTQSPESQVS